MASADKIGVHNQHFAAACVLLAVACINLKKSQIWELIGELYDAITKFIDKYNKLN